MDRSAKPIFTFVNLSHPDELKDEETQLRIRRLAMSEVGRARRKLKTKTEKNEIVLEFQKPSANPSVVNQMGAMDIDAFGPYPIELDESSRCLVSYIFQEHSAHSRQLRGCWWPVCLADKASFYNVLANARLYMLRELTGTFVHRDDPLSLTHHNNALRELSLKMKDHTQHSSDQMLGNVCSMISHMYILGSFVGWEHHRDALTRMTALRGGVHNISQEALRVTISWTDLVAAFSQDIPPCIPLPGRWIFSSPITPGPQLRPNAMSVKWKEKFPITSGWITIFDDIYQLITQGRGFTNHDFKLAETTGCWLEPTLVRLLSIRPLANGHEAVNIMEEICRLGTLLFVTPLWRRLGASPVWTFSLTSNLLLALHSDMIEWNELKPLLVWSIYFAAIETRDPNQRSQFAFMLAVLMGGMQIQEWDGLMQVIKSVLWVEGVSLSSDKTICDEVLSILHWPGGDDMQVLDVEAQDA